MPESTEDMLEGNELFDMELDEVSLVRRGANHESDVVLFKSGDKCKKDHNALDGDACADCGWQEGDNKKKVEKFSKDFVVKPVPVPANLARIEKGDKPGHPFRGNQWTGGSGGGTANSGRAMRGGKNRSAGTGRQKYPKGDARNTPRSASDQARFGKPKKKATRGETFGTWQSESSNGMKMSRNGDMTIRQSDSGSFVVSDHGQRIEHQIPRGATMAQARRHVEDSILAPRLKTATAKPKPKASRKADHPHAQLDESLKSSAYRWHLSDNLVPSGNIASASLRLRKGKISADSAPSGKMDGATHEIVIVHNSGGWGTQVSRLGSGGGYSGGKWSDGKSHQDAQTAVAHADKIAQGILKSGRVPKGLG